MLRHLLLLTLAASFLGGCAVKDKLYTPSEAEKKLVAFCQKENSSYNTFLASEFKSSFSISDLTRALKSSGIKIPEGKQDLAAINDLLNGPELKRRFPRLKLPQEAAILKDSKKPLAKEELRRLNRLIMETAFPDECPRSLALVTHIEGKTLWVYIPFNEPIFTVKPSPGEKSEKKKNPLDLLYLGGEFDEKNNFAFSYDIVNDTLPPDPVTYGSGYNEKYGKIRQLIYMGLQESIFNIPPQDAPAFVIVVIADIGSGVAIKSTLYLNDLKQYLSEALPPDEYYLREQNEIFGSNAMIGDTRGDSLEYTDVQWPGFLVSQIKTRAKYKFTQSDFKPNSDPDKVIAACAANTLRFYPFTDYEGVYLYNIRQKRDMLFDKKQLKTFEEESWWAGKGKLTTIHFNLGTVQSDAEPKDATPFKARSYTTAP
ncbi:MAG: hypothetical protein HQL20_08395 [Candidatus Omnitrophica bacterium]|nr:hypothetical protein [Candidatus Omnitrophota bacterium]